MNDFHALNFPIQNHESKTQLSLEKITEFLEFSLDSSTRINSAHQLLEMIQNDQKQGKIDSKWPFKIVYKCLLNLLPDPLSNVPEITLYLAIFYIGLKPSDANEICNFCLFIPRLLLGTLFTFLPCQSFGSIHSIPKFVIFKTIVITCLPRV